MPFSLSDALAYLRCPVSGAALVREGDALISAQGLHYPIVDGIADLTVPQASTRPADYDKIAGSAYNVWIFNPATMAFTWGLGVLKMPLVLRPAQELTPGVFLEVPCGTGIFTARAYRQRPATRVLAMDYSMGMLRAARARAHKLGVDNAVFVRADVARLPLADACLDGCLSLAGFHAFPDPAAAAVQIGRVLKPQAKLTLSVACSGERRISDLMIDYVMKPGGYFNHGLPVQTYSAFLERAGFARPEVQMAGAVAVLRARRAE